MEAVLDRFRPDRIIYLPGASGEVTRLSEALARQPDRMADVHVVSCLLPGFNRFDYAALHERARLTTFLLPSELRSSFQAKRVRVLPHSYARIVQFMKASVFDVAVAQVAPPDARGACSLGVAADFSALAWSRARERVMVVNHAMPPIPRSVRLPMAEADLIVEIDAPLLTRVGPAHSAPLSHIAGLVADIIPDGAAIQVGIGGAPSAVLPRLAGHRRLRLASGLVTDEIEPLYEAGALSKNGEHVAGIAFGSQNFYDWLARSDIVSLKSAADTHNVASLASLQSFHAINSALEVDLLGQINLEWIGGRLHNGPGGAPEFMTAAAQSEGGQAITALPATTKGLTSRIVPRLASPAATVAGYLADTVVTEYGVARLRHMSIDERAEALIRIAAPAARSDLEAQWRELRARF